mmetsp:Transcript_126631/g.289619  ORF Transcript_126631/g.289619 Transcript_126631/m.289619 type:complete len:288 (+) Transcript_126631:1131-1994(+)
MCLLKNIPEPREHQHRPLHLLVVAVRVLGPGDVPAGREVGPPVGVGLVLLDLGDHQLGLAVGEDRHEAHVPLNQVLTVRPILVGQLVPVPSAPHDPLPPQLRRVSKHRLKLRNPIRRRPGGKNGPVAPILAGDPVESVPRVHACLAPEVEIPAGCEGAALVLQDGDEAVCGGEDVGHVLRGGSVGGPDDAGGLLGVVGVGVDDDGVEGDPVGHVHLLERNLRQIILLLHIVLCHVVLQNLGNRVPLLEWVRIGARRVKNHILASEGGGNHRRRQEQTHGGNVATKLH